MPENAVSAMMLLGNLSGVITMLVDSVSMLEKVERMNELGTMAR